MLNSDILPKFLTPLKGRVPAQDLPDQLISMGRYWVSAAQVQALMGGTPNATRHAVSTLQRQNLLFSPAKGFYVMIPPEYREWKSVPGDWFIDPMMKYLNRDYYVGFLTAAAFHGASHQAPQTFQVVTAKPIANRDRGRARLRFLASRHVSDMATEDRSSKTGSFRLAARETTLVDLVWRQKLGGGLSNVATVLSEIGELDGDLLARLAPLRGRATVRRLGWLLERYRQDVDLHWLRVVAKPEDGTPALLTPGAPRLGSVDRDWSLLINSPVEPDL